MMRIQQLQYLEKIVESGSINEAAKALFLSQPSLSNAIKELEQEMDLQLLVRQKSGVSLNVGRPGVHDLCPPNPGPG